MSHPSARTVDERCTILMRAVEEVVPEDGLSQLLRLAQTKKRPLRVKLGIDPTASDVHLGFAVVLRKLRQFQDLGHIACLVIGDFTATIGDPSGRSKTRPILTRDQVVEHVRSYERQLYKILDRDRTEILYNSDWLGTMSFSDVVGLASQYTVARADGRSLPDDGTVGRRNRASDGRKAPSGSPRRRDVSRRRGGREGGDGVHFRVSRTESTRRHAGNRRDRRP